MNNMTYTDIQNIRLHEELWTLEDNQPVQLKVVELKTNITFSKVKVTFSDTVICEYYPRYDYYNLYKSKYACLLDIEDHYLNKLEEVRNEMEEIVKQNEALDA